MSLGRTQAVALREFIEGLRVPPPPSSSAGPTPLAPDLLHTLGRLVPSDVVVYNDMAPLDRSSWSGSDSLGSYDTLEDYADDDADDEFFDLFWSSVCSHPDRTGDFESVITASDFHTLNEWRSSPVHTAFRSEGNPFDRELILPLSAPPGHSRRVRFIRVRGRDFDDTDRALATLVRPHLLTRLHTLDMSSRQVTALTARQRQLLTLVARGYSNAQVARTLGISALTVRTHLEQAYARLGVHSRGEAVALLRPPRM